MSLTSSSVMLAEKTSTLKTKRIAMMMKTRDLSTSSSRVPRK